MNLAFPFGFVDVVTSMFPTVSESSIQFFVSKMNFQWIT